MNIDGNPFYTFSHQIIHWLYRESVLALFIFAIVYLSLLLLRPRRKELHMALWTWVFIRLLLPPDFSLSFSLVNLIYRHSGLPSAGIDVAGDQAVWENSAVVMENQIKTIGAHIEPAFLLASLWLIGCAVQGTVFFTRRRRWQRIANNAPICHDKERLRLMAKWRGLYRIKRSVTLKESASISAPFTLGILHPVIVMPVAYDPQASLFDESFIAHELAHVKRFDDAWILFQSIVNIFYFFHPVLWLVNRKIYSARECICDSLVIATGAVSRNLYSRGLLFSFKSSSPKMEPVLPAFKSRPSTARERIENLMKGDQMKNSNAVKIIIACGAIFILPLAVNSNDSSPRQIAAEIPSQHATSALFTLPISPAVYRITSGYGSRLHPITHQEYFHRGIDLSAVKGTPILAAAEGVVQKAVTREMLRSSDEKTKANGLYVEILHDRGYLTRYTQMDTVMVIVGQRVEQGERIGQVGSSGLSTGPHLHFEIWNNGSHINPEDLISF